MNIFRLVMKESFRNGYGPSTRITDRLAYAIDSSSQRAGCADGLELEMKPENSGKDDEPQLGGQNQAA